MSIWKNICLIKIRKATLALSLCDVKSIHNKLPYGAWPNYIENNRSVIVITVVIGWLGSKYEITSMRLCLWDYGAWPNYIEDKRSVIVITVVIGWLGSKYEITSVILV